MSSLPHGRWHLRSWSPVVGTVWGTFRCDFVGGSVSLEVSCEVQKPLALSSVLFVPACHLRHELLVVPATMSAVWCHNSLPRWILIPLEQ